MEEEKEVKRGQRGKGWLMDATAAKLRLASYPLGSLHLSSSYIVTTSHTEVKEQILAKKCQVRD